MMLRVNLASISTGIAFVVVFTILHCLYILYVVRGTGGHKGMALGMSVFFPPHPFVYLTAIFLIGLYAGGRIFR
jgi:hypothetical protein